MKDFEHKKIRITLNSNYGWASVIGAYIKEENNFLVIYNPLIKGLQYISLLFIKTIEILGEYREGDDDGE
ncbi:MAG: hypothetical protein SOV58_00925 [Candidatus Enteromonas sp.]|nr:hypothetical protein [Candidatus Enteromonas sp.]